MDKKSEEFLFKYLNNASPVGYEARGQQIWLEYLQPFIDDQLTDTYGNAVGIINPGSAHKVAIAAHADEISWRVGHITDKGYMYVTTNGGADHEIAPSMRTRIHVGEETIPAVFGWPAIHTRRDRDEKERIKPKIETIVLDCGCHSKTEVEEMGIHVGCVVTPEADLMELNRPYLVGRALDNRIGGFMIAEVAKRLHERAIQLPFGLYIVNTVQEEVGLKGASMSAHRIKPDLAIVTDVTHDTQSPHYKKIKEGDIACGQGPVLSYAPSVHNNVRDMLIKVAEESKIPFQRLASSNRTSTDADAFAYAGTGIATALISLPLKYMHTTVEMVHKQDIAQVIELFCQFLAQLDPKHSFSYFK
ncbi:MAG: M20/M25/M40 family metallo-hydrolase [Bacteroidota bacterium]